MQECRGNARIIEYFLVRTMTKNSKLTLIFILGILLPFFGLWFQPWGNDHQNQVIMFTFLIISIASAFIFYLNRKNHNESKFWNILSVTTFIISVAWLFVGYSIININFL